MESDSHQGNKAGRDPLAVGPSAALCGLGVWFWLFVFAWLWVGCPPLARALGLAWFLLGLIAPRWWLLSFALLMPLFGSNPGGGHMLFLIDMGLMGLVARHLGERAAGGVIPRYGRLDPWIALFVILSWISLLVQWRFIGCEFLVQKSAFLYSIYNHFATAPMFGLRLVLDLTLATGLYSALRDRPWSSRWQRALGLAFLVGLSATAVAGLANYAGWLPLEWWRGENPDLERFGYVRLQSLFWHSGWLAQYIAVLTPLALTAGLLTRRKALCWAWWAGAGGALGLTQLLTFQRGGWLALAGALMAVVIAATLMIPHEGRRRGGRLLARLGMVTAALAGLALLGMVFSPELRIRLSEILRVSDRLVLWQAAWELIRYHFWAGLGIGNYFSTHVLAFPPGNPLHELRFNNTAHDLWLHIWAERGLISLLVFCVIQVGLFARVTGGLRRCAVAPEKTPSLAVARVRLLAVLGGLTALTIDGIVQYVFHLRVIELLFWILAGLSDWPVPGAGVSLVRKPVWPRRLWIMPLVAVLFAGGVVWENRVQFMPWRFYFEGEYYHVGGGEVTLSLPPGAVHAGVVNLPFACWYPYENNKDPVTLTVSLDGKTMNTFTIYKAEKFSLDLKLPPGTTPASRLVIRSSMVWSPYRFGLKQFPFMNMGVLYRAPTVVTPAR